MVVDTTKWIIKSVTTRIDTVKLFEINNNFQKFENKYFLMVLPNDLIIKKNCSKEIIEVHSKKKCTIIATKTVKKSSVSRGGILSVKNKNKEINGANITVPFKRDGIAYLDQLS